MDLKVLRLECLKLTYAHGREPAQAVANAEVLEKYILKEASNVKPQSEKTKENSKSLGKNKKSSDKLDSLL